MLGGVGAGRGQADLGAAQGGGLAQAQGVEGHDLDRLVRLGADSLLLVRQSDLAAFRCEIAPWDLWWFEFLAEQVPLPADTALRKPGAAAEIPVAAACLRNLSHRNPVMRTLASARFSTLLHGWSAAWHQGAEPGGGQVDLVLAAMVDRPDGRLTSAQMAHLAGVGERRLRQLFVATVGVPPMQAYLRLRVEMAADLLCTSPATPEEVPTASASSTATTWAGR